MTVSSHHMCPSKVGTVYCQLKEDLQTSRGPPDFFTLGCGHQQGLILEGYISRECPLSHEHLYGWKVSLRCLSHFDFAGCLLVQHRLDSPDCPIQPLGFPSRKPPPLPFSWVSFQMSQQHIQENTVMWYFTAGYL